MRRLTTVLAGCTALVAPLLVGPAAHAGPADRSVHYRGVSLTVPADWAVVDLDAQPGRCVRLDVKAVYVGTPSEQQDCPAHAVGRASTIHLGPASATAVAEARRAGTPGQVHGSGRRESIERSDSVARERAVVLPGAGVAVAAAWGAEGDGPISNALASLSVDLTAGTTAEPGAPGDIVAPAPSASAPASPAAPSTPSQGSVTTVPEQVPTGSVPPRPVRQWAGRANGVDTLPSMTAGAGRFDQGDVLTGMAFDTCAAPSAATMASWRSSPYAAVGIYIGGSMRACGDGVLSTSWIATVSAQGWGFIPIYVGVQAPCVAQGGLALISTDLAVARQQGTAAANDGIVRAQKFGLGPGSTVYYDMEWYPSGDAACSAATLAFTDAWTETLHAQGYGSGIYGGASNMMADMVWAIDNAPWFDAPDQAWTAYWHYRQTVWMQAWTPTYPDAYWTQNQRLHQYTGNTWESWGGTGLWIDRNWVDARLSGMPRQTDYGPNATGPGGAGFVMTGDMRNFPPAPGMGRQGKAYQAWSSGTATETNGATWSPSLARGIYWVEAYVPDATGSGVAKYTLKDAQGTRVFSVNQVEGAGARPLGTVLALPGQPVTVHMGNNGGAAAGTKIWADEMRFVQVGFVPGAPTNVAAAGGDGRAVVTWGAASANGADVTGYTVTAQPGGATVTVPGGQTQATITGLTNGTAYTFTVRATNIVGDGPDSAATVPVVPALAGGFTPVAPVRLVDTRAGTPINPVVRTAVPAGGSVRFTVAGGASPVPLTASTVLANVTVTGGSTVGVVGVAGSGTSIVNWSPGQTIANLTQLSVAADGTVTLANSSPGPVHIVVDLQGYTSPQSTVRWTALDSVRLLDTRAGAPGNPRATALGAGESLEVAVTGGVVPAGAPAAALRVTATGSSSFGALTVSPDGSGGTSVVNYGTGETVGNAMFATLSATGTVRVTNVSTGTVHVVVDELARAGDTGSNWLPVLPTRLLDTRFGTTANPQAVRLGPGEVRTVTVAGAAGTPVPIGAPLLGVNLTVTGGSSFGWVGLAGSGTPSTPLVNYGSREARAGFGWVAVAADGTVRLRNQSGGTVDVIVDTLGHAVN